MAFTAFATALGLSWVVKKRADPNQPPSDILDIQVAEELKAERLQPMVPLTGRLRGRVKFDNPVLAFRLCGHVGPARPTAKGIAIFLSAYGADKSAVPLNIPTNQKGRQYFYPQRAQPQDGRPFIKLIRATRSVSRLVIDLLPWTLSDQGGRYASKSLVLVHQNETVIADSVSLEQVRLIVGDEATDRAISSRANKIYDAGGEWRKHGDGWQYAKACLSEL